MVGKVGEEGEKFRQRAWGQSEELGMLRSFSHWESLEKR